MFFHQKLTFGSTFPNHGHVRWLFPVPRLNDMVFHPGSVLRDSKPGKTRGTTMEMIRMPSPVARSEQQP